MLLAREHSVFLLVDVQENNVNSIHHHEQLIANCKDLLQMAQAFAIPILASEHTPESNGSVFPLLREYLPDQARFSKSDFSCLSSIATKISPYRQILIAGIETHLCVLQTVVSFLETGKQVFVVADATEARFQEDKEYGLQRMQALGAQIVTKQMVLFEWARNAEHPQYQKLSAKMLK